MATSSGQVSGIIYRVPEKHLHSVSFTSHHDCASGKRGFVKQRLLQELVCKVGYQVKSPVCAGVGYLLSPASTLSFGVVENEYRIDFEEARTDTLTLEMLIKGMASQSSQEVRDQFDL